MKEYYKKFGLKGVVLGIFVFVVLSGLGAAVFERVILPPLSTWPILKNISFFDSQAPLVITRREEVRIENGINTQEVIGRTRGSLVRAYDMSGAISALRPPAAVSGFIATTDGLIVVPAMSFAVGDEVQVAREDQSLTPGTVVAVDSLSGVALVKIAAGDLPVLNEARSTEKKSGEQLIAIKLGDGQAIHSSSVELESTALTHPSLNRLYDLSSLSASLDLDPSVSEDDLGSVVVDKNGAVVGLISKVQGRTTAIRIDDLQMVLDNFFSSEKREIVWPQLRVTYLVIGPVESALLGLPEQRGVLLRQVYGVGGLTAGDFITAVDLREITEEQSFQKLIFSKKPGEIVQFQLLRNGLEMEVDIEL